MATVSLVKAGWFSKCRSRLSAAHIRFNTLPEIDGLKAGRFQNVALALALRMVTFNKLQELHGLRAG
eukprot:7441350-Pyramimonas_sp.AAC.1